MTLSSIGLTNGHIMVGDSSNIGADVAMSGDVTITNAGVTSIKSSVGLAGSPTTTTQTAGDNSTKIATTAYVDAAAATGGAATYQYLKSGSGATYTRPAGCKAIHVEMVGGAGGGGGTNAGSNGGAGGDTIFNSIHAAGGTGGLKGASGTGGSGGTGGTGSATLRLPGGGGQTGAGVVAGAGGDSYFGGGGASGGAGGTNTGGGGGGVTGDGGGGGGAGECVIIDIASPSSTYTYTIGAAGTGGTGGGGAGGSGLIIVTEYY